MRNNKYLSDRAILLDLLITSKHTSHLYDHGVLESSHGDIKDTFEQFQHDEHDTTELLFSIMQEHGWYNSSSSINKNPRYPLDELERI